MAKPKVFLSYSHDDKKVVRQLHEDLESAGIDVWWDDELLPGQDWLLEIRQAIKRSDRVVLCLSTSLTARDRSGIYPELLNAVGQVRRCAPGQIFLIPVRLDECEIPPVPIDDVRSLDSLQYVDLFGPNRDDGFQSLLEAIGAPIT